MTIKDKGDVKDALLLGSLLVHKPLDESIEEHMPHLLENSEVHWLCNEAKLIRGRLLDKVMDMMEGREL